MNQTTIYIDDGIKNWLKSQPRDFSFSKLIRSLLHEYMENDGNGGKHKTDKK